MADQTKHVSVLLERLARILQNDASLSDLKPTQWEALRFLSQANRFSRTPSGLTAYLGLTKGTVSQTVNALERKGLVAKTEDAKDKRLVGLVLTEAGRSYLKGDPLEQILSSLDELAEESLSTLTSSLETLLTSALEKRGGRPFGVCQSCRYFEREANGGNPHRCGLLGVPLSQTDSELICREQEV